jgi:hypothetical protein
MQTRGITQSEGARGFSRVLLARRVIRHFLEKTMEYREMNVQQRAEYLLSKGVEAKLDIDPEALAIGYAAHAIGVGKLPCGYHDSEQAAIDAGTTWLRSKAMTHNAPELTRAEGVWVE